MGFVDNFKLNIIYYKLNIEINMYHLLLIYLNQPFNNFLNDLK